MRMTPVFEEASAANDSDVPAMRSKDRSEAYFIAHLLACDPKLEKQIALAGFRIASRRRSVQCWSRFPNRFDAALNEKFPGTNENPNERRHEKATLHRTIQINLASPFHRRCNHRQDSELVHDF